MLAAIAPHHKPIGEAFCSDAGVRLGAYPLVTEDHTRRWVAKLVVFTCLPENRANWGRGTIDLCLNSQTAGLLADVTRACSRMVRRTGSRTLPPGSGVGDHPCLLVESGRLPAHIPRMADIILPYFCEVRVRGTWTRISLEDALRLDKDRLKRCPACHGRVRAHGTGSNGAAAHFEHDEANPGCMWCYNYDGRGSRMHRKPME
jgi:hypothetical protein